MDLGCALENAENAGIAKDARDRKLERETVAAVNLHGVIGIGPGDAGGQELRHAGLEIAALARILLPGREVSELARDHDLDRHHRDLVGDAGKIDDRLAELLALLGVGEGLLHGRLRHADRARRGLDARRLKGLHELPKAQSLDAAEQVLRLHLETVEGDFVLLHAAIAEHLDLGTRHTRGRKRMVIRAARLLRQQHGEPAVAGFVWIGAHEQRHEIGAHGVRNPCLVAVDLVNIALSNRARLERGEIGAGIGLGEHCGGNDVARGELRQPVTPLFLGATADDQLGGDFGTRSERTNPDIAARELLRDHAHRLLTESKPAILLRDREPEHAQLRHLREDVERDVAVGAMPLLRLWCDFAVGELVHLVADRRQRLVQPAIADRAVVVGPHQLDQAGAALDIAGSERLQRARHARSDRIRCEPDIGRTHDLALAHGNAALNLGEVFADAELDQQLLDLAQCTARMHPLGIGRELPHRFDIGREPGKAVRGALLAIEQPVDHLIIHHDAPAHRRRRVSEQRLNGLRRRSGKRNQLSPGVAALGFVQHGELRTVARSTERHPLSLQGTGAQDYACSAQKQRRSGMSGRLPRVCAAVAALLTTWNDIDRLG